jgi:hypothetical protein
MRRGPSLFLRSIHYTNSSPTILIPTLHAAPLWPRAARRQLSPSSLLPPSPPYQSTGRRCPTLQRVWTLLCCTQRQADVPATRVGCGEIQQFTDARRRVVSSATRCRSERGAGNTGDGVAWLLTLSAAACYPRRRWPPSQCEPWTIEAG